MAKKERKPLILENIYLETAGAKGASIGKAPDGKTIFVRNAVPGDTVDVRILKKKTPLYGRHRCICSRILRV